MVHTGPLRSARIATLATTLLAIEHMGCNSILGLDSYHFDAQDGGIDGGGDFCVIAGAQSEASPAQCVARGQDSSGLVATPEQMFWIATPDANFSDFVLYEYSYTTGRSDRFAFVPSSCATRLGVFGKEPFVVCDTSVTTWTDAWTEGQVSLDNKIDPADHYAERICAVIRDKDGFYFIVEEDSCYGAAACTSTPGITNELRYIPGPLNGTNGKFGSPQALVTFSSDSFSSCGGIGCNCSTRFALMSDDNYVFVSHEGTFLSAGGIFKVSKGAASLEYLVAVDGDPGFLPAVESMNKIFYASNNTIMAVPKNGGMAQVVTQTENYVFTIAATERNLYWIESAMDGSRVVRRIPIDGNDVETIDTSELLKEFSVNVDFASIVGGKDAAFWTITRNYVNGGYLSGNQGE